MLLHLVQYGRYQVASAGVVKVTAFEEPSRDTFLEAGKPVCDVRIYPAGLSAYKFASTNVPGLNQQCNIVRSLSAPT